MDKKGGAIMKCYPCEARIGGTFRGGKYFPDVNVMTSFFGGLNHRFENANKLPEFKIIGEEIEEVE